MIWHDIPQNSEIWQALRCGKVTASQFGIVMANEGRCFGEPAKDYALRIALEIANGVKSENIFSNEHTERGHLQEPIARMLYEEQNFVDVTNGGFFDWGAYGDSPDGLVEKDGVIEIKCVIDKVHWATIRRGKFDPSYKWQLIGHLECTGRDWVDFVSYCSVFPEETQLSIHRLYRADYTNEIERLRARRDKFIRLVQDTLISIKEAA